ncbi:MAG: cobalt transporter CbiM [Candidatus Nealsonbacteria bacterium]|nr:cobalt transporter CbiM [Candidatus Nealsonbacteria bacterium]
MHISEAMLTDSLEGNLALGAGMALAAAGTAVGLRKMDYERIPQVAVLSSAFFVASLIQIPGPIAVHLVLNGLMGLILGWAVFPAVLIALVLQAVLFLAGGLTAVGVNTVVMALPAIVCYYALNRSARSASEPVAFLAGFAAGATGVLLGIFLAAAALITAGEEFKLLGEGAVLWHLPVAVIDGLITGSAVVFLRKVRPELLEAPLLANQVEVTHG